MLRYNELGMNYVACNVKFIFLGIAPKASGILFGHCPHIYYGAIACLVINSLALGKKKLFLVNNTNMGLCLFILTCVHLT